MNELKTKIMKTKKEKTLNITLKDDEIENFREIMKKCAAEDNKIGFQKKVFEDKEIKLIKEINSSISE